MKNNQSIFDLILGVAAIPFFLYIFYILIKYSTLPPNKRANRSRDGRWYYGNSSSGYGGGSFGGGGGSFGGGRGGGFGGGGASGSW